MPDIDKIIDSIDDYLRWSNKLTTNPVEINEHLNKKGILSDSSSRPGAPIRKLLRNGQIPLAYQVGVKWEIPMSNGNLTPKSKQEAKTRTLKKVRPVEGHKLEPIAELISEMLREKHGHHAKYLFEHKPDWLFSYPSKKTLTEIPVLSQVYAELNDKQLSLATRIGSLTHRRQNQKQSFDIWFDAPYSFAVEFDELQHFNQYRKITLKHYHYISAGFPLELYKELNDSNVIRPGKSGFTKLKSKDPLFPELLDGEKQDNRIRQRAFRDFLKDLLPLKRGLGPTLRIPYPITNHNIKEFTTDDLENVKAYIHKHNLI